MPVRKRDLAPRTVYRFTVSGSAEGAMNRHGPWVYGATNDNLLTGVGAVYLHPVDGPTRLSRGLPLAGSQPGYTLEAPDGVNIGRIAEAVSTVHGWPSWWGHHVAAEERAVIQRARHEDDKRRDLEWLVASLVALGYDLGPGAWDRSNEWARYVSHVADMLPPQRHVTTLGLMTYAVQASPDRRPVDACRPFAQIWLDAPVS